MTSLSGPGRWTALLLVLASAVLSAALAPASPAKGLFAPKLSWLPGDPASPVVAEPGRNILDNSSFEQGTGGWSADGSELCDREPDGRVAWHGGSSCRLFTSCGGPDAITIVSPIFRAEEGGEYSVSCYARASGPGVALHIALCSTAFAHQIAAEAGLTGDWRRIQATGKAGETRRQTYFVLITVSGIRRGVDAWVDAVQAERGPVTPYRPSGEVELGAVTDRFANTYYWGEPVTLRPVVANWGDLGRRCNLTYSLCDYTGAEVRRGELHLDAPPGRATRAEVVVGRGWRGYGQAIFDLTVPGEEDSARYRCRFATIPRPAARGLAASPFFGLHGQGHFARNWDLLEAIGCETAKVYCGWGSQEKGKPYDFTGIDAVVEGLLNHHIVPIVCLGTWYPAWAEIRKPDGTPTGELDLEGWRRHVAECVTHLKWVRLFESWNEIYFRGPTANTVGLMWAATEVCRRLRPDAVMMTNAVAGVGEAGAFAQAFLRAREGRPLDALSLHYPWDTFRDSPERGHMRDLIARARRLADRAAGHPVGLYITESGFHGGDGLHAPGMAVMESDACEGILCTQRQKADWMVQAFLIAMEQKVRAHCEFDWCGYPTGPPWYSSLTFNDMSPRPALAAYAAMVHLLRGARVVRVLPAGKTPVHGLVLDRGGQVLTCLWSASGDTLVAAHSRGSVLRATDAMGTDRSVPVRAGAALLKLGDGPVYLRGEVDRLAEPLCVEKLDPTPWVEGKEYAVTVAVANPFAARWRVVLRPVTPEGWRQQPREQAASLPAGGRRLVSFRLTPRGSGLGVPFRVECRAAEGVFAAEARADLVCAQSAALAEREPLVVLDGFEDGIGRWHAEVPQGAVLDLAPEGSLAHSGARCLRLHFEHSQPIGTWASAAIRYAAPRKWSAYEGLTFWVHWKERPACELQIHVLEDGGGTYFAVLDPGGRPGQWRRVSVRFRDLKFGGWSHDPDGCLNLDSVAVLALVGVGTGGASDLYVDDLQLWKQLPAARQSGARQGGGRREQGSSAMGSGPQLGFQVDQGPGSGPRRYEDSRGTGSEGVQEGLDRSGVGTVPCTRMYGSVMRA